MSDESGHISGVHNYCDRWCERCPFTERCGSYAFGKEIEAVKDEPDGITQLFWKHLDDKMSLANAFTEELGDEDEEEAAAPVPEPDGFGLDLDDDLREETAKNHECALAALNYYKLVDEWVKTAGVIDGEDGSARLPGEDPAKVGEGDISAREALQVVLWFQHFIYVKLRRALTGMLDAEAGDDQFELYDANGSAKIALIAMDRSLAAWGVLAHAAPEHRAKAIRMIGLLAGLRRSVEEALPGARAFVRPGFDTGGKTSAEE